MELQAILEQEFSDKSKNQSTSYLPFKQFINIMSSKKHLPIRKKLSFMFHESDLIATRFIVILAAFLWASALLYPSDTFDSSIFNIVKYVMPKDFWGMLFLIQACAAFYSLFYGARKKVLIFADSMLGCFLWTSMSAAMIISSLTTSKYNLPAAMSSVTLTFASWWILARYPGYKNDC